MEIKEKNKALFYVLMFSFFWSLTILFVKYILMQGISSFSILVQTQLLVALIVGTYLIVFKRKLLKTVSRKSLPLLLTFGAVGSGVGIGISYFGLALSTSINYGFIIKTSAVFTIIIAHFWHDDDRIDRMKIFLSGLFLFGIYMLSTNGALIVPQFGDLLILAGAAMLGLSNNMTRQLTKYKVDSTVLTFFRMLGAFVVNLIFALFLGVPLVTPSVVTPIIITALFMVFYVFSVNKTIEHSSASYLSMMSMLVPVIVAFFGILVFKERIGILQIIGGVVILVSGVVLEMYRMKKK